MCRFDELKEIAKAGKEQISIHLMCRFDIAQMLLHKGEKNFNTSHVSVRLLDTTYNIDVNKVFQYISCVGSILPML